MSGPTPSLGIPWKRMPIGKLYLYKGTYDGLKSNVCRANKTHYPKQFTFVRDTLGQLAVKRIV